MNQSKMNNVLEAQTANLTRLFELHPEVQEALEKQFLEWLESRLHQLRDAYPSDRYFIDGCRIAHLRDKNLYKDLELLKKICDKIVVGKIQNKYNTWEMVDVLEYRFNSEKAMPYAHVYAEGIIDKWSRKIIDKLGDSQNYEVGYIDAFSYSVKTNINGCQIQILQDIVLNWSSKGTPFHQFPARIYLDGEFISEHNFKNWRSK